MSLFVDSSIWFAAVDTSDGHNARAKAILQSGELLVTTDHVLVETWSLIHHRINRFVAERFWEQLRNGVACIEQVSLTDLENAWHIGRTWSDQDFSIFDRTSFVVMQRLGIERAASLDEHFAIFRYGPKRRQAFTIVR